LRLIATQVFNEISGVTRCVSLPGMKMSNRSAKFVAALFTSILAGTNLAAVTDIRAQAVADNCLTAPKGATPAGSHWYYRLERGTKRQCWYLKDENDKAARTTPQEQHEPQQAQDSPPAAAPSSATADPVQPPTPPRPTVRKSIANAHAELTPPRARAEPDSSAAVEPQTTGAATGAAFGARMTNSPAAAAPDIATPSSAVATRWPDSSGVSPPTSFRLAAAEPQNNSQETDPATLQPAPPPVVPAAVDSSMAKQSASMQMLFLVMAGALAMAGITASLVFRFGRARASRPEIRRDRRAIWDSVHAERSSPSMLPGEDIPLWRRDDHRDHRTTDPRDPRAPDDPERRVTEMLSRLARSAQN
jgi:hypothetical protein